MRSICRRKLRCFQPGETPPSCCTVTSVRLRSQRPVGGLGGGMLTERFMGVAHQQIRPWVHICIDSRHSLKCH